MSPASPSHMDGGSLPRATRSRSRTATQQMCTVALGAALLAVSAWVAIPLPWGVPVTLQSLVLFSLAGLVGVRPTLLSVAIYLVLGGLGLPVFAGFGGGPGVLLGPGGGYLWGMLWAVPTFGLFMALCTRRRCPARTWHLVVSMVAGLLVCYGAGTTYYALIYAKGQVGVGAALTVCVLPYLLPDGVKLAVACVVARRGRRWFNSRQRHS